MFQLSATARRNALMALIVFHIALIIASNYLVQLPIMLWGWHTTWGAFSFPFIFLATDLTVRLIGKPAARLVIARVMLPARVASYIVSVLFHDGVFAGWDSLAQFNAFVFRIALGSFMAYVLGQLLDIQVFDRLRRLPQWWVAPAASGIVGQAADTLMFFQRGVLAQLQPLHGGQLAGNRSGRLRHQAAGQPGGVRAAVRSLAASTAARVAATASGGCGPLIR